MIHLQRLWRMQAPMIRSKKLLANLNNTAVPFETFLATLRDGKVLGRAKTCLQMAIAASATQPVLAAVNVRKFVAAWLIDGYPTRAMDNAGQHPALVNAAKKMVGSFTAFLEKTTNGGGVIPTSDEFMADFNAFMPLFESWREADVVLAIGRIDNAIRALNEALDHLDETTPPEMEGELYVQLARLTDKRWRLFE